MCHFFKKWILILFLFSLSVSLKAQAPFRIGFSQCTTNDGWRIEQLRMMEVELSFFPDMEMVMKDAGANNLVQIRHIEEFLREGIDLLIVSPNESDPLTPVVEKVFLAGIPVIVIDRKISGENYTAYVGGDNHFIGVEAGNYAARLLNGRGRIVQITGLEGSSPAQDRQTGLLEALSEYPDIELVASRPGDWVAPQAKNSLRQILDEGISFDLVFAHNDVMALAAHELLTERGERYGKQILGVDGLAGENGGLSLVSENKLQATFLYPNGGGLAIQLANKILTGQPYSRNNILPTVTIDSSNLTVMRDQAQQIDLLYSKIERQKLILEIESSRNRIQRLIMTFLVLIILLSFALILFIFLNLRIRKQAHRKLENKTLEIELQNSQIQAKHDELLNLSHELEEALQSRVNFFTNISHEIRTPLSLIMGPVEDLLSSEQLSPQGKEYIQLVYRNTIRLYRLVNQMLDFRKAESKKLKLAASGYDIVGFLRDIFDSFQLMAQKRSISMSFRSAESELLVWFDHDMMDKVFFNLLSNAFKFTPDGGRVTLSVERRKTMAGMLYDEEVVIRVEDNGVGISKADQEKIFIPFMQVGSHRSINGSGLGLSLSKEFVELHRGKISIDSSEGKGAVLTVSLPLGNRHLMADELASPDLYDSERYFKVNMVPSFESNPAAYEVSSDHKDKPLMLVVEDMPDVRDYIRLSFSEKYQIIEAENGSDGLQLAIEEEPDVVVSDVMMPEMSGIEMTRLLKSDAKTSHIPVVLLTAKATLEHQLEGFEGGADCYLSKPFSAKLLDTRIQNLLESQQRIREHYRSQLDFNPADETISRMDKKFIERLSQIIEQNLGEKELTVEDLAAQMGMSRVKLYRKIKKLTDMSISEFVVSVKLRRSLGLLVNSGKTISEVAFEVGFNSLSYYTRCFRNQFKMSPSEYIDQQRAAEVNLV